MAKFLVPLIAFLLSWASCSPLAALDRAVDLVRRAPPPASWSAIQRTVDWNIKQIALWGKLPGKEAAPAQFLNTEGRGVRVYVVDSGIYKNHDDFRGAPVFDFKNQTITPYCGDGQESVVDELGHGTSVAGLIRRIARQTTLVNVKIECATGTTNDPNLMAQAISDITAEHNAFKAGQGTPSGWRGSVINLSISTFNPLKVTIPLRNSVKAAIAAGIPIMSSSGNMGSASGLPYPCSEIGVICNSASDDQYNIPATSYFGPGIAFTAPGMSIVTTGLPIEPDGSDNNVIATRSGTCYANAHLSAIAAYYVGFEGINNDVAKVRARLNANAQLLTFRTFNNQLITSSFPNLGFANPARNLQFPYAGYDTASGPTQFNPLGNTVEPPQAAQILADFEQSTFGPVIPETPRDDYIGGIGPF